MTIIVTDTRSKSEKTLRMTCLLNRPSTFVPQDQPPKVGPLKIIVGYSTPPNFNVFSPVQAPSPSTFVSISVQISMSVAPGLWEIRSLMMEASQRDLAFM